MENVVTACTQLVQLLRIAYPVAGVPPDAALAGVAGVPRDVRDGCKLVHGVLRGVREEIARAPFNCVDSRAAELEGTSILSMPARIATLRVFDPRTRDASATIQKVGRGCVRRRRSERNGVAPQALPF